MSTRQHIGLALTFACLPALALAHDDMDWPAKYANANGTPCCTMREGLGDCKPISNDLAMSLRIGSTIDVEYPSGRSVTRINAIHFGKHAAICRPGCLFTVPGV